MKKLIGITGQMSFLCILLLSSSIGAAEVLVCDLPRAEDNVVTLGMDIDGVGTRVPITIITISGNNYVLIKDITEIGAANFEVWFINDQGRESDHVPFVLKPRPSGPMSTKVVIE